MNKLICICGSAGSIESIYNILNRLKRTFYIPIVILVHVERFRVSQLASALQSKTKKTITVPEDLEMIKKGRIYVAPSLYHIQVEEDHTFSFTVDEPVNYSRPSIDILLETAAWAYRENLTVIILSGASGDGAKGARIVEEYGGKVIIQNPEETQFKIMLERAIEETSYAKVLSIDDIIMEINQIKGDTNG